MELLKQRIREEGIVLNNRIKKLMVFESPNRSTII